MIFETNLPQPRPLLSLIAMPTSPAFIIILLSVLRAGLIPALANPCYTSKEFEHVLNLTGAKRVLSHSTLSKGSLKEVGIEKEAIVDVTWPSSTSDTESLWSAYNDDLNKSIHIVEKKGKRIDWKQTAAIFFR